MSTTFNPYQSGGATKTVVTPNFNAYGLTNSYANFTPAGSTPRPQQIPTIGNDHGVRGPAPGGQGSMGLGRGRKQFSYDGMGVKNRMQWFSQNPDKVSRHHCEICCCDCLGKDSWKAHLKGQQHLKKLKLAERQGKTSSSVATSLDDDAPCVDSVSVVFSSQNSAPPPPNFCEICNCHCTNSDAFSAHLRGQKHQRALKLYQKKGKSVPSYLLQPSTQVVKVIPKTNFTTGGTLVTGQMYPQTASTSAIVSPSSSVSAGGVFGVPSSESSGGRPSVGIEYIEEEKDAFGRVVNYKCSICKCDMNNIYMRDEHLKGRKHLTEYKMKVNPSFKVADPKLKATFSQIEKMHQMSEQEELRRRQQRENGMLTKIRSREMELLKAYPGCVQVSEYRSPDDYLITSKHSEINPPPMELKACDKFLANVEMCLKAVADKLASEHESKIKELKGVMRVGFFAKNILLKGEKQLELVVLCEKKPTEILTANVCQVLNEKLEDMVADEKFLVSWSAKNAWITVKSQGESALQCTVHVTSPEMREPDSCLDVGPERVLDREKCCASLAETRRSKWFDMKCKTNPTLCQVVRILRDLCRRIPTWNSFPCYIIELVCDQALRTVAHPMGPSELMRRFFEILASGILLPGDCGIYDPCEKNNQSAAKCIKLQDCQDITTSSQHALRLMALGQTDKILGTADKKRKAQGVSANAQDSTSTSADSEIKSDPEHPSRGLPVSPEEQMQSESGGSSPKPPPAKKECPEAME